MSEATSVKALAQSTVGKTQAVPTTDVTAVARDPRAVSGQAVDDRWMALATEGHGPQRHGPQVNDTKLERRVVNGEDPAGDGTQDAFLGTPHRYGRHATRFDSKEDFVRAEHYVRTDPEFDKITSAKTAAGQVWALITLPLKDVLGDNYWDKITGKTRIGGKKAPTGAKDTEFSSGLLKAFYRDNGDGDWVLHTLYPAPHGKREQDDQGRILPDPLRDMLRTYCNVEAAEAMQFMVLYLGDPQRAELAAKFRSQLRYIIERNIVNTDQFEALTDEDFDTQEDLQNWLIAIEKQFTDLEEMQKAHEASHDHG